MLSVELQVVENTQGRTKASIEAFLTPTTQSAPFHLGRDRGRTKGSPGH